ncbi:arsenate reductase [Prolixibacteraceae bacterium JC049]|nr:arsenate reductase [Prolixibacteraceae bacterium JC049]
MTKKVYFLSTCDTCKRIMKEVNVDDTFELQDIKTAPINKEQLEQLHAHTNSYEALFNKRARKYKELGLKEQLKEDADFKQPILDEYTFLKRPVFVIGDDIFVGNAAKTVAAIKTKLEQ